MLAGLRKKLLRSLGPELKESQHELDLLRALNHAALAAAKTESPGALYREVGGAVFELGYQVNVFEIDTGIARLVHHSYPPAIVKPAERVTGFDASTFSIPVTKVRLFECLVSTGVSQFREDSTEALRDIFAGMPSTLPRLVASMLNIARLIGVPVKDETDRVRGLLFLMSNSLKASDVATAEVFAQVLSLTLRRLRLVDSLQLSLAELADTQAQLLQAQKMEALGRLTGGIAHDINNLLTPAFWGAGEVGRLAASHPEIAEAADVLDTSLARCADLTDSLLTFGRRRPHDPERVAVDDVIERAMALIRRAMSESVRIEWTPGAPGTFVEADTTQLHQVLVNLAVNANDAMPEGGVLAVSTHRDSNADGTVVIRCSDTGTGIDDQVRIRLFEPFFTTKEDGGGSGLGLAVVDGIIRQHRGTVELESTPGTGTTFLLRLPQVATSDPTATVGYHPAQAITGCRILVLEDDVAVRRVVTTTLTRAGAEVTAAGSLAQAREFLTTHPPPDLALLDVRLGDGNSTQLAVELLEQTRVLMMTGNAAGVPGWDAVERAGIQVISKPFRSDELLETVSCALDAHTPPPDIVETPGA